MHVLEAKTHHKFYAQTQLWLQVTKPKTNEADHKTGRTINWQGLGEESRTKKQEHLPTFRTL